MSMSTFRPQRLLTPIASLVGVLGISGGVYGLMDPMAFSHTLGITVSSSSSPALPFLSFVGARNLGGGITVLALALTGQTKALGLFLMCGVTTSVTDAWICSQYGAVEGKAVRHAVLGIVIGLVGSGLYLS